MIVADRVEEFAERISEYRDMNELKQLILNFVADMDGEAILGDTDLLRLAAEACVRRGEATGIATVLFESEMHKAWAKARPDFLMM